MINSRTKGRAAEQEVAGILRDELGLEIHRNWQQQAAQGGCDLVGVPGWGIEIKRAKEPRLNEWWTQTAEQAARCVQFCFIGSIGSLGWQCCR